jgi:hypothetical protein
MRYWEILGRAPPSATSNPPIQSTDRAEPVVAKQPVASSPVVAGASGLISARPKASG